MEKIIVRPMEEKDINDVLDIFSDISDTDKDFLVWDYKSDDIIQEIENIEHCHVAEIDGEVVGLLIQLDWKLGYSLLDTLVVHPDYRGLGVASKMLDYYHKKFPKSTAKVEKENKTMQGLLKKYGYEPFQWMRD